MTALLPGAHHHGRTRAILGKGLDLQHHRRKTAVSQFADAADRIAGHALVQAYVFRRSRVRIRGKPLFG